jgi:2-amino-4-hydroxy-6-hydroxymethyldihydropteridine diphosphokinase
MPRVYLGLGSNIEPEKNLALGVAELERRVGSVELSPVYRAPAIGFESPDFLNAVAAVDTDIAPESLLDIIEEIHDVAGRERSTGNKWVARSLDIDLLLYGDLVSPGRPLRVPRGDVLDYAFVLRPLADLAPDGVHPVTGRTFAEHWAAFDAADQPLTPVELDLRDAQPSTPN